MNEHAVVIVGGGPTGLMLAGELALAGATLPYLAARGERLAQWCLILSQGAPRCGGHP